MKLAKTSFKLPRLLGTLGFLAAWLVPWRPAFRARAKSGLRFSVHHRDAIGRHIAKYGMHEPLVTAWIGRFLDGVDNALVVDVGANLGWHALHAAKHRNVAQVVAFEPDPFNAWLLHRNVTENHAQNVIAETRALGAEPGVATLFQYKSSNAGRHSLAVDHGFGSRQVPLIDLDGALGELGLADRRIALIKIEVEGYEPAVLAGAAGALARTDAVLMEYSSDWSRAAGFSAEETLGRLQALGFVPFALLSGGGVVLTDFQALGRFEGSLDVVVVQRERLAELASVIGERAGPARDLQAIAEANKRVK
jgi:FkbM family methyltransferase